MLIKFIVTIVKTEKNINKKDKGEYIEYFITVSTFESVSITGLLEYSYLHLTGSYKKVNKYTFLKCKD